jgi:WD40 repeat protein
VVSTGRELPLGVGKFDEASSAAFSADGKALAVALRTGGVELRDTSSGKLLRVLPTEKETIVTLAFSPDGKSLAGASDWGAFLWGLAGGGGPRRLPDYRPPPRAVAFTPDGKAVVCATQDGCRLVSCATGKEIAPFGGRGTGARCLAISPGGKLLASGGLDHAVRVWSLPALEEAYPFAGEWGGVVTAGDVRGGALALLHRYRWESVVRFWAPAAPGGFLRARTGLVRLSPDGKKLARPPLPADGTVHLLDVASGKEARSFGAKVDGYLAGPLAFSPDNSRLAVLTDEAGYGIRRIPLYRVRVFDARTGKALCLLDREDRGEVRAFAFSPDGRLAVLGSEGDRRRVEGSLWDVRTGKQVRLPGGAALAGRSFAFTPDGKGLVAVGTGEIVRLRDLPSRRTTEVPASSDRWLTLWELASGQVVLRIECPALPACCQVSPDGRLLAWGDREGAVGVVDLFTGRELRRFHGHRGAVASVAFREGGRVLVSGSSDTTALLWGLSGCKPEAKGPADSAEMAPLWEVLASDAKAAHRAIGAFVASPRLAVPFLAARLRPVPVPDPKHVRRLLAELADDSFPVRERAEEELVRLERAAAPLLRAALAARPPLEPRRRVQKLLAWAEGPALAPVILRNVRAVRCLEMIGTAEARRALPGLAKGAPEALLTQEANAALRRLEKRVAAGPLIIGLAPWRLGGIACCPRQCHRLASGQGRVVTALGPEPRWCWGPA